MITEEEVKAYGYRPVLFADGKGIFAQVWECTNPRVWKYFHSRRGSKLFVDGVRVQEWTPAAVAELLNRLEPKELTAEEIFQLADSKD
jgi:hypothetical protein